MGTHGHRQDVQLNKSCGTRAVDESAVAAAWKYRFKPAIKDGAPVAVTVTLPIEFRLPA